MIRCHWLRPTVEPCKYCVIFLSWFCIVHRYYYTNTTLNESLQTRTILRVIIQLLTCSSINRKDKKRVYFILNFLNENRPTQKWQCGLGWPTLETSHVWNIFTFTNEKAKWRWKSTRVVSGMKPNSLRAYSSSNIVHMLHLLALPCALLLTRHLSYVTH